MAFRGLSSSAKRRGSGRVIAPAVGLALLIAAPAFARPTWDRAPEPIAPDASVAPTISLVMLQDGGRRLAAANTQGAQSLPAELAADADWSATPQPVPLPASALAGGAGLAGLWVFHRLRRRSHASHR